jgi:hypothetical protein
MPWHSGCGAADALSYKAPFTDSPTDGFLLSFMHRYHLQTTSTPPSYRTTSTSLLPNLLDCAPRESSTARHLVRNPEVFELCLKNPDFWHRSGSIPRTVPEGTSGPSRAPQEISGLLSCHNHCVGRQFHARTTSFGWMS